MSGLSTSTMAELLTNTKSILESFKVPSGLFESVVKINKGTLQNPIKFPFISILPVREVPVGYENNKLISTKAFRVEAWSHKTKSRAAMRSSLGIIENVKDIFMPSSTNWLIPDATTQVDTVFDLQVGGITSSQQPIPYRNGFVQSASITFDAWTKDEYLPNLAGNTSANWTETTAKILLATVLSTIKTYSSSELSTIKSFKDFTLTPQALFPVVYAALEGEAREHTYAGIDTVDRTVMIHILHKMFDKEVSLTRNLAIAETIKEIMYANSDFGGIVSDFNYEGIEYGQLSAANVMVYGCTVECVLTSMEVVDLTGRLLYLRDADGNFILDSAGNHLRVKDN